MRATSRGRRFRSCAAVAVFATTLAPVTVASGQRPALDVPLSFPTDVVVTPGGRTLIADSGNGVVRRLLPGGKLEIVTGAGIADAPDSRLVRPTGLAVTADGIIVIADPGAHRVWWLPPGGTLTPIAGTGVRGFAGDGGPAALARLDEPFAVAISAGGGILIADRGNDRVRRIDANGIITTVAGGGLATPIRPGPFAPRPPKSIPALQAVLSSPSGIAATEDGGFVVADTGNAVVRRYFFGTLTIVAGTGLPGAAADEGTAVKQPLAAPTGVAVAPDGGLLVTDQNNQRVHSVAENGQLTTVAGTGRIGAPASRSPADQTELAWPAGVAALPNGGAVIADTNAHRILRVSATGATRVIAGSRTFVAASPRRRAVQAPTAVLTRTSWGVRKGCRLRPRYRATVSAPGYLKRWDGKELWNGGVRPFLRRFKTRAVDFGYGRHRVYFWTTKTSFSEATLVVRRPACR